MMLPLMLPVLVGLPLLVLAWTWTRVARPAPEARPSNRIGRVLLSITTLSFAWYLLGALVPNAIGGPLSTPRLAIIAINTIAMALMVIVAGIVGRPHRIVLSLAALTTLAVWCYLAAVNSAV